jgi:hypothetical protein
MAWQLCRGDAAVAPPADTLVAVSFLRQSSDWRERIVLRLYRPLLLADFGQGVLDAIVETAAYVLQTISDQEDRDLTLRIIPDLLTIPIDGKGAFSIPKYQAHRGGLKRHQANQELRRLRDEGYIAEVSGHYQRFQPEKNAIQHAPSPHPLYYPPLLCYRMLDHSQKEHALLAMLRNPHDPDCFVTSPRTFQDVSGAPFSYWVSERVRRLFTELPRFEGSGRTAKRGPSTGDDSRRVRAWWEVSTATIGRSHRWVPLSKGGSYSPYYADIHLLVAWDESRRTFLDFWGRPGRMIERPEALEFFFRPGLTWPRRTQKGISVRVYPAGCIFAD